MNIVAIDLGKFNSMVCFYQTQSTEYRFQLAKTDRRYLTTLLKSEKIDLVVMEACSCSGWVDDLCQELRLKTLVCSTHEEAWRWRNVKRKTDKDDALKLARLAAVGQLKATHVPDKKTREYRGLIKYRKHWWATRIELRTASGDCSCGAVSPSAEEKGLGARGARNWSPIASHWPSARWTSSGKANLINI